MTIDTVVDLGQRAMIVTLMAAGPLLLAGMIVGLLISLFQSVTQVQEITLTFIPKIVAVFIAFIVFLPWMAELVVGLVRELFTNLDQLVR